MGAKKRGIFCRFYFLAVKMTAVSGIEKGERTNEIIECAGVGAAVSSAGAIFAVFAAAAAVFGYFFVYKKTMKGEKRLSPAMMLWSAVFLCYLIVVFGGVMLSRGGIFGENSVELIPFSSYREAWITFDRGAWRNIILNIALFVPLGFLLPLGIRWFRRFWRTYLAGLFLTGMIEGAQLIFHRGGF